MEKEHEKYMRRCLQLARGGEGRVAPNPMVGAVIVCDGRIIGEGFHRRWGEAHAEVNAVRSVRPDDEPLLKRSTIYVSLEPCSHYGKTPPCARLIIEKQIPRVVVGCRDPFEKVSGRGIEMLREAGVEVIEGVLEEECRELNRAFITFQTLRRPYITLKWARSSDGFIDAARTSAEVPPARLSTSLTQISVHHLRARHQAILVGHRTLLLDRPSLTVRAWSGRNPQPVVLGRVGEDELPAGWQAYGDIDSLLEALHRQNIQTLLVEGGAKTLQSFIDRDLWDEAWEEHSSVVLGGGVAAPKMPAGVPQDKRVRWGVGFAHWRRR